MQSRVVALTLGLYLFVSLLACNSKPQDSSTATDNSTATTATDNSTSAASTPAGSKSAAPMRMAEAPKPIILPAGTVLTVRLGQAVGSKISQPGQSFTATLAEPVQV